MWTVSKLAKSCGLSRSTLLYYEAIGLLRPAARSDGNYRWYGEKDLSRLRKICVYRDVGLRLEDIRAILEQPETQTDLILERRLVELQAEIAQLREHQRGILMLMKNKQSFRRIKARTKEKWVAIMKASGFSETDMRRWHVEFERAAPEEHQTFLESLHIAADEIDSIRQRCRQAQERA